MLPIIRSKELSVYVIRPDNYNCVQIIAKFFEIEKLYREEPPGYGFEIRSELSRLWLLLMEETKKVRGNDRENYNSDVGRLKIMLQFINDHYTEKISTDEIAAVAVICSRECNRTCLLMQTSP